MQLRQIKDNDIKISLNGKILSNTESRIEGCRLVVKFLKPEFSYNELTLNVKDWVFKAYCNKQEIELIQLAINWENHRSGFSLTVEFGNIKEWGKLEELLCN